MFVRRSGPFAWVHCRIWDYDCIVVCVCLCVCMCAWLHCSMSSNSFWHEVIRCFFFFFVYVLAFVQTKIVCVVFHFIFFRVFTSITRKYDAIDLSFPLLSRRAIWHILIVSFFFDDFISVYCALAHTFTHIHLSLFYSFSFIHSLFHSHLIRNINICTSNIHTYTIYYVYSVATAITLFKE